MSTRAAHSVGRWLKQSASIFVASKPPSASPTMPYRCFGKTCIVVVIGSDAQYQRGRVDDTGASLPISTSRLTIISNGYNRNVSEQSLIIVSLRECRHVPVGLKANVESVPHVVRHCSGYAPLPVHPTIVRCHRSR